MITSYLEDELDEILENADDKFWEEFNKEYEKLWMEEVGALTAETIEDIIKDGLSEIIKSGNVEKIEKYKNILNELRNAIVKALKTQKPLGYDELEEYLVKLYKMAGLDYYDDLELDMEDHMFGCNDYNNKDECVVNFLMYPYDDLDETGKLVALEELLYRIDKILSGNT